MHASLPAVLLLLDSPTYALVRLQRAHRAALEPRLAAMALNYGAELLLAEVGRRDGLTQGELALGLGVKPPSVTKVAAKLEAAGLISRLGDESDGRVTRFHLTEDGQRRLREVEAAWHAAEREALAGLSAHQRQTLGHLAAAACPSGGGDERH